MALRPASAAPMRRAFAARVIEDYVIPLLDGGRPLYERLARGLALPALVHAIMMNLKEKTRQIAEKVRRDLPLYRELGFDLPEFRGDPFAWFREAAARRPDEEEERWLRRLAVAALIILAQAAVEESALLGPEPELPRF